MEVEAMVDFFQILHFLFQHQPTTNSTCGSHKYNKLPVLTTPSILKTLMSFPPDIKLYQILQSSNLIQVRNILEKEVPALVLQVLPITP